MSKLNICIDIDGTITDPYHFIPYLNELYNKNITNEECNTIDWQELYGIDMETMLKEFHEKYMHSYDEAVVIEEARDVIKLLKENHNLNFVTARSAHLKDITRNWLDKNDLNEIEVYLLGSDYKIEKAKELECHIFIEDNPSNALQLANEGMHVLLIDTNYNKEINHEKIKRVTTWAEINDFILSYV